MSDLTIVIPAWRCRDAIARSLSGLAAQPRAAVAGAHVIVAVNDGDPGSVAAAETCRPMLEHCGYRFEVIATPPGRKAAFAAAETLAAPGPRIYLDQDARLSPGALAAFRAAVAGERPCFVAFRLEFTASHSRVVRRFLRAWLAQPWTCNGFAPVT